VRSFNLVQVTVRENVATDSGSLPEVMRRPKEALGASSWHCATSRWQLAACPPATAGSNATNIVATRM
jgi:hypothetical protein